MTYKLATVFLLHSECEAALALHKKRMWNICFEKSSCVTPDFNSLTKAIRSSYSNDVIKIGAKFKNQVAFVKYRVQKEYWSHGRSICRSTVSLIVWNRNYNLELQASIINSFEQILMKYNGINSNYVN